MTVIGHNIVRRVDSFDGFDILAHPLPNRDDRTFRRGGPDHLDRVGVTYGSHDIKIARPRRFDGTPDRTRLAILVHHGGGREVLEFFEGALPIADALLMLPEREQYALAYTILKQASECQEGERARTSLEWRQAHVDGRIRRSRAKGNGSVRVWIETEDERDIRRRA